MKLLSRSTRNRTVGVRAAALAAILCIGAAFAQQASAGCLDMPKFKHTAYSVDGDSGFRLIKADYRDDEWGPSFFHAPIVGLWAFTYTGEGNTGAAAFLNGQRVDAGNTLWFADGNEITYSGVRNPIAGATCLGIWKRTGEYTYVLNHIGLSWDPTASNPLGTGNLMNPGGGPGAPGGPAFIKQYIVLAKDGQSYSGSFTINNLLPDGKTPAGTIKGSIKATRVTIDTDTQEATP
jgi:hypothetical protein